MGNNGFRHGGDGGDQTSEEFGHVRSEVRKIEGRQSGHEEGHVRRGRSPTVKGRNESQSLLNVENSRNLPVADLTRKAAGGRHVVNVDTRDAVEFSRDSQPLSNIPLCDVDGKSKPSRNESSQAAFSVSTVGSFD